MKNEKLNISLLASAIIVSASLSRVSFAQDSEWQAPLKTQKQLLMGNKWNEPMSLELKLEATGAAAGKLLYSKWIFTSLMNARDPSSQALLKEMDQLGTQIAAQEGFSETIESHANLMKDKVKLVYEEGNRDIPDRTEVLPGATLTPDEELSSEKLRLAVLEQKKSIDKINSLKGDIWYHGKVVDRKIAEGKMSLPKGAFENGKITKAGLDLFDGKTLAKTRKVGRFLVLASYLEGLRDASAIYFRREVPGLIPYSGIGRDVVEGVKFIGHGLQESVRKPKTEDDRLGLEE